MDTEVATPVFPSYGQVGQRRLYRLVELPQTRPTRPYLTRQSRQVRLHLHRLTTCWPTGSTGSIPRFHMYPVRRRLARPPIHRSTRTCTFLARRSATRTQTIQCSVVVVPHSHKLNHLSHRLVATTLKQPATVPPVSHPPASWRPYPVPPWS